VSDPLSPADPPPHDAPELETVTAHDDVAGLGVPVALDELADTLNLERELLTALVWAPPERTAAVVIALAGDADRRDGRDAIPLSAALFYGPDHGTVFGWIVDSVDAGAPLDPAALAGHLTDPATRPALRNLLLEIASPNPHGPWPVPTDTQVPQLARAVVDGWHRRGYRALLERMATVLAEERSEDLAAHWVALSRHQQLAEARRSSVLAALCALP